LPVAGCMVMGSQPARRDAHADFSIRVAMVIGEE
jgi:hypothetical protein